MTDIIERAKTLLNAITPGSWRWDGDSFIDVQPAICPHGTEWDDHGPDLVRAEVDLKTYNENNYIIRSSGYDASSLEIKAADSEFIAAAPELVQDLIDEIVRLRARTIGPVDDKTS